MKKVYSQPSIELHHIESICMDDLISKTDAVGQSGVQFSNSRGEWDADDED